MTKHAFHLKRPFPIHEEQEKAVNELVRRIHAGENESVLLGVTGSGKTYTMANVIEKIGRPTLIISHNKTLAAQLYQEFRDFFPENAVSYFVSYYDYYQPEAYIPQSDTYIEKETDINEEIDKLRLTATTNLLTRPDSIVVASVSAIYNLGSPREYGQFVLEIQSGMKANRETIKKRLVQLQYERNDWDFKRGTFRIRGNVIDVYLSYDQPPIRISIDGEFVKTIETIDPVTGEVKETIPLALIYPSKHYMTNPATYTDVFTRIEKDLDEQYTHLKKTGKIVEAERIRTRVNHDLDMIREMGYVNGIENYSRYFDGRKPGDPPYSLLDYFKESMHLFFPHDPHKYLTFIDESHITIPQIRGMYHGDQSRKETLIDYGFRLPSALDNRPLRFDEFLRRVGDTIYVSATPDEWELSRSGNIPVEQLVRPTGLLDPTISVRPIKGQVDDLMKEISLRTQKKERSLVTVLTKRMAEDLSKFFEEKGIRVKYLHSDIKTLERSSILTDLRKGNFDVLVGVNLLREGLDLPEVSLVAIMDADKQGFLRNKISLIQTMGRAARHVNGAVVLYADVMTPAMTEAIEEGKRRRAYQEAYNTRLGITPTSIEKPIRNALSETPYGVETETLFADIEKVDSLTPRETTSLIQKMTKAMKQAGKNLDFELAAELRDSIARIKDHI